MRSANYVAETTTSIAGTLGDGAVTLTAVTNRPRFSTVFGTAARSIRYAIEDVVNMKFEQGIGSVASNVLTRTKPQITWTGSVYSDGMLAAIAPIQFGATPTSGNVIIRMSALAESQGVNIDVRQNTITGDANWRDYQISEHILWSNNGAGATLTANREYYACTKVLTGGLLTGVQIDCTTAVAASTIALALYELGSTGLPTQKIADFNGFTTTTTGIKTDTTTATWSTTGGVWMTPGWYAIGFIASHAIAIRQTAARALSSTPYGRFDGYGWADIVYVAGSGTTLPTAPSPATMISNATAPSCPWLGLRVVA